MVTLITDGCLECGSCRVICTEHSQRGLGIPARRARHPLQVRLRIIDERSSIDFSGPRHPARARSGAPLRGAVAAMGPRATAKLKAFFASMAHYSRLHLAEAMARGGFRTVPVLRPDQLEWPDGTPRNAGWAGVDALMSPRPRSTWRWPAERSGHAYYAGIAATTHNVRLKRMADEFASEEAEHVAELEKWIDRVAAAE
jgi:hypothetical protein